MKIGAIYPQTEINADPGATRDFVQAVEELGYNHLFVADHVLGADPQYHSHPSLLPGTGYARQPNRGLYG